MRLWVVALVSLPALAACGEQQPSAQPGHEQARTISEEVGKAAPGVEVARAWVRENAGRTGTAAVFMTITAASGDRLIGGSSPVAEKVDLMTMRAEDGTMGMRYIDAIDLPAGQPVSLDPTGLHVWLEDLKKPLEAGETFPLTLRFQNAGTREVAVSVVEAAAAPSM